MQFGLDISWKKIAAKKPFAAIYLLDCCMETCGNGRDTSNGFSPFEQPDQTVTMFACGLGKTAIDQSKNGRNGIFMEILLKHIRRSNTGTDNVLGDVAHEITREMNSKQKPHRMANLRERVVLVIGDEEGQSVSSPFYGF